MEGSGGSAKTPLPVKILTVSDGVAAGVREDKSVKALSEVLVSAGFEIVASEVSPDGIKNVKKALKKLCKNFAGLIVTTGGTGFGPRDLTPEATLELIERRAEGIAEAMRLVNPLGRLSRAVAGTYKNCLIINTPGSPGGAAECLNAVIDILPHALKLMAGEKLH